MKSLKIAVLCIMMICVALVTGCSKKPEAELQASKTAIDAVVSEGAEKYASEEMRTLNEEMSAALAEIETQDGKFLKNYDKANQMLVAVESKAQTLKAEIPARKEMAKTEAQTSIDAATAAIQEATALLAKAPRGKGSMADIQALASDVAGLKDTLNETTQLMTNEDFIEAGAKAKSVTESATAVSAQITEALAKVAPKKATR